MSWYIHPSKQLRDDELPPELVVTNRDGSIEQAYVPYNASERLQAENAKLREELDAAKHDLSVFSEEIVAVKAENAKLREQIHWLKQGDILHVLTDQEYIDQCERERLMQVSIDALDKENAKLRELAAGIGHLLFILDVDYCAACPRDDINHPCPVYTVKGGECLYETDLRELGVEVNDG